MTEITLAQIQSIALKTFGMPITDFRAKHLMQDLVTVFTQYGPTTCGLWAFARMADHDIYEEDLPPLQA